MSERRYNDDEMAAIFAKAADTQDVRRRQAGAATGMTLAELQEIGREAGIAPEAVQQAATLLDQRATPSVRRFLGLPVGVGRTVELGRQLTDAEWERLVVDLRETFDARGHVSGHGSFRQWTNGNLQALLEPSATGHRLRLKTVKGSARGMIMGGFGALAFSAVSGAVAAFSATPSAVGSMASIALVGVGLIAAGAVQLPTWARQRLAQMDGIIQRITNVAAAPPQELSGSTPIREG